MSRWRRGLWLGLGMLLLVGIGLVVVSQSAPVRRLVHARAEAALTAALAREVRVEGVDLRLWQAGLELRGIRVAERPVGLTAFAAEAVRIRWSWLGLLRRHLILQEVTLLRPRMVVAPSATSPPPQDLLALPLRLPAVILEGWTLGIRQARVQDGTLDWVQPGGLGGRVEGLRGSLTWTAGGPVAALEAAQVALRLGDTDRRLEQLRLEVVWAASAIAVRSAEFRSAGGRVQARGQILLGAETPRLDLEVGLEAPLSALLAAAGWQRAAEGDVKADGRLTGPFLAPAFQGQVQLALPDSPAIAPLRVAGAWQAGRLDAEVVGSPQGAPQAVRLHASFTPTTSLYQLRLEASGAELAGLGAWPTMGLALAGLAVPQGLVGQATVDVNVTGRGRDLATLRGQGRLRVEGLGLAGQPAAGRLEARFATTTEALALDQVDLQLPGGRFAGRGSLEFASGRLRFPLRADVQDVAGVGRAVGLRLLGGRLAFAGEVQGTREVPRLRGRLDWREARLGPRSLDRIEGPLELTGRRLSSPRLLLQVGRTRVLLRGSLEAAGHEPIRSLDFRRDLRLDLKGEMRPGRTADLVDLLPDGLEVQGDVQASGRLAGSPQALRGEVAFKLEHLRAWKEAFRRGEGLLTLEPGGVRVSRIVLQRGLERVTGEVSVRQGGLAGRFESSLLDLAGLHWLAEYGLAGRGALQVDLTGTTAAPALQGRASVTDLRFRGAHTGPARATFAVAKTVDVELAMAGARLRLGFGDPPGSLRADLALDDGDLEPYLRLSQLEADALPSTIRATGQILLRGRMVDLAAGQGQADLAQLRLTAHGQAWESRTPVRASWQGGLLTLQPVRVRSGEREVTVQGTLRGVEQADLRLQGELPLVALSGLVPGLEPQAGLARVDVTLRGPLRSPDLRGRVGIEAAVLALPAIPAPLQDVYAGVDLQGDRILIPSWQGRLARGLFRGSGEARRASTGWELATSFRLEDSQVSALLGPLRGKGELTTGLLSLIGSLRTRGAGASDFWQGLNGEVALAMRDGEMGRHSLPVQLLSILNIWQLLDLRLTASGMPYRRLSGDFRIRGGVARTENLVLDSSAMMVNAVGEVSLLDQQVDLQVGVKPFQALDRLLTPIPIAGWLLGGREKGLVVAFYHVTGPLRDPEVTALPLKDVTRNVFGIFQRLLDLPEALTAPFQNVQPQPARPENSR